jgi:hypothetical protein
MAFELTTRFIAQSASSEEEARAELALFLVNTPANLMADAAQCDELEMAGPDLEWPDFR